MSAIGGILLQNYFECPSTQFCFKDSISRARLIQEAGLLDSIVAYSTHATDFCNTIGVKADMTRTGRYVGF
jgi:hypothetical protein